MIESKNDPLSQRNRLLAKGRYLDPDAVAAKLSRGEGTVVVLQELPKAPTSEWWVDEDLIAMAPTEFEPWGRPGKRTVLERESELLSQFAQECLKRHIDEESGDAMLIDTLLSESSTIAERFPNANVISIQPWLGAIELGHVWEQST
ncbi:MAG: hypothetical protein AAGF33_18765 [Pseudomonadota bacterium]